MALHPGSSLLDLIRHLAVYGPARNVAEAEVMGAIVDAHDPAPAPAPAAPPAAPEPPAPAAPAVAPSVFTPGGM